MLVPLIITASLLAFVGFWCFICLVLSRAGGWAALATTFPATYVPDGRPLRFQTGKVGHISYGNCLTMRISAQGLYLAVFPIFRLGHPPLLIPWQQFHDLQETQIMSRRFVQTNIGEPTIASLTLPFHVIEQIPTSQ